MDEELPQSKLIQTNISLFRPEHRKLKQKAKEEGVSMAEMIRRAVNAYIPDPLVQEVSIAPNIPPLKIIQKPDIVKPIADWSSYDAIRLKHIEQQHGK